MNSIFAILSLQGTALQISKVLFRFWIFFPVLWSSFEVHDDCAQWSLLFFEDLLDLSPEKSEDPVHFSLQ
jgi:hypothetical protein